MKISQFSTNEPAIVLAPRLSLSLSAARRRAQARGLTLIELALAVVILGILALLAGVSYRAMIRSAHTTEAVRMVGAIRIAQETVKAETGAYVNLGMTTLCPQNRAHFDANDAGKKWGWDPNCSSGAGTWSRLPVQVDGPVRYGYATSANTAPGQAITVGGLWDGSVNGVQVTWPSPAPQDWYLAIGRADLDGNGIYSTVIGTSLSNELWTDNEGE